MTFAPSLAAASIAATLSESGEPTLISIGIATGPPMPAAPVPLFTPASATLALAFPCQGHDAPPVHDDGVHTAGRPRSPGCVAFDHVSRQIRFSDDAALRLA